MPNDASTADIVDPQTGSVLPSVLTFEQAYQTYRNFTTDNRERNNKNAAIARKINGEQPWNPRKLRAAGQSWRSNRPTGFMSSLLKRLTPPYHQVIDQLPLLTFSRFPNAASGTEALEDTFRKAITDCIRRWPGWPDFLSQLIDENIGYGYAAVGREDEFSWRPKMYRSDEALFYVGCPQEAARVKIWAIKEDFFVDDIVETIRDPEIAALAGWQVDNLVKKLNTSSKQFDDKANSENERVYEDLIRENNLASSFTSSIRVVKAGHIFAVNPSGGVDHYIFDREDGVPLFFRRARYDKMEQCLTLFSAEVGDRTLHGSKGAGRALYNTHVSVEQARNLIQDALHLSGLLILRRTTKAGSGSSEAPSLTVNHPFAIVGEGYEVLEKVSFQIDSEAFFALDRHATMQAEVAVGSFMPGQVLDQQGARRTASEVNYTASIDAQIRAGMLSRFADQMFALIDQLQRRICRPEILQFANEVFQNSRNSGLTPVFDFEAWASLEAVGESEAFFYVEVPRSIESDAVEAILRMLENGLTVSQIAILANSSSRANVEDAIASQSGVLDMVVSRYSADPTIDTVELKRRDIASKLGGSAAERLLNVDLSPLSALKQHRQQLIEMTTILEGSAVPVDPTDEDMVHLGAMLSRLAPMLSSEIPLDSSSQFLTIALEHADAHVQSATQKGVKPAALAEITSILDEVRQMLQGPTTEGRAATAAMPAMSPGVAPVTDITQTPASASETPPVTVAGGPQSTIDAVASPPRPTPPTGG
jgi:hypothetical protein